MVLTAKPSEDHSSATTTGVTPSGSTSYEDLPQRSCASVVATFSSNSAFMRATSWSSLFQFVASVAMRSINCFRSRAIAAADSSRFEVVARHRWSRRGAVSFAYHGLQPIDKAGHEPQESSSGAPGEHSPASSFKFCGCGLFGLERHQRIAGVGDLGHFDLLSRAFPERRCRVLTLDVRRGYEPSDTPRCPRAGTLDVCEPLSGGRLDHRAGRGWWNGMPGFDYDCAVRTWRIQVALGRLDRLDWVFRGATTNSPETSITQTLLAGQQTSCTVVSPRGCPDRAGGLVSAMLSSGRPRSPIATARSANSVNSSHRPRQQQCAGRSR